MSSYRLWLCMALTAFCGCASGPPTKSDGAVSPGISVALLRADPESRQLRAFPPGDILAAGEPLTVEVTVAQAAQVAVVLHSPSGESEDLAGDPPGSALLAPHTPRRFVVPRRSPPGVSETELRLLVVASNRPLSAAARGLLRLPCGAQDDGRGDRSVDDTKLAKEKTKEDKKPAKEKSKDDKKEDAKENSKANGDKSKPPEGDKMGPGDAKLCASSAGIFAPLTVIPIVISSK